jgi:hypothetical protein
MHNKDGLLHVTKAELKVLLEVADNTRYAGVIINVKMQHVAVVDGVRAAICRDLGPFLSGSLPIVMLPFAPLQRAYKVCKASGIRIELFDQTTGWCWYSDEAGTLVKSEICAYTETELPPYMQVIPEVAPYACSTVYINPVYFRFLYDIVKAQPPAVKNKRSPPLAISVGKDALDPIRFDCKQWFGAIMPCIAP